MKLKKYKKTWTLLVCCAALYILLCLTGLLDKQKIWQGVPVDWPQGKHQLFVSWCRSPTAYFLLVEKVGKAPPRGKPLGYPRLRGSPIGFMFLISALAC